MSVNNRLTHVAGCDYSACQPQAASAQQRLPIVIVGTGPVGIRVAQELRQRLPLQPLLLFGAEPWQPYDRVKLTQLLAGEIRLEQLALPPLDADPLVTWFLNCPIVSIDRANGQVIDIRGGRHGYHRLVLAVGSKPHVPQIPGIDLTGVYTFRSLNDAQALMARSTRSRHVVVIGGGLLGLEAAKAMQWGRTRITVVQQGEHLMNRQLDPVAASRLQQHVERQGIGVITGNGVRQIVGNTRVEQVVLRDGSSLKCDTVIVAAGIQPNRDLALAARLPLGQGIKVNDQLQTRDEAIYAVGECAEHRGVVHGLVAPGYAQAAVAAEYIAHGRGQYQGSLSVSALKVIGKAVFSIGSAAAQAPGPGQRQLVFQDDSQYRRLVLDRGRLTAAVSVGDWSEIRRVQEHVVQQRPLSLWQRWRFRRSGQLWPDGGAVLIQSWPQSAVVCNCMNVTKGALQTCVQQGACSAAQLSSATGAGSLCGSCQPLLQEFFGQREPRQPVAWSRVLLTLSFLVGLLVTTIVVIRSPVADSVQGLWQLELLWRDSFWKQVTGYTLLGMSMLAAGLSLRKRIRVLTWLKFDHWRLVHSVIGSLIVAILVLHTGFSLGDNLNFALMSSFLALLILGAAAAIHTALSHKLALPVSRRWQQFWLWGHILTFWPIPALLLFHLLSVYYF